MDIGVRVETEDMSTGDINYISSAYLTLVALDEDGRPKKVPPLILVSEDEKRRNQEALLRKDIKLYETKKLIKKKNINHQKEI